MGTSDSQSPRTPQTPKATPLASGRLDSWKEIAHYLGRDVRTVQRWEEASGLPVYRLPSGRLKGGPVYAFRSELDAWLRQSPPPVLEKEAEPAPARAASLWKTQRAFWAALALLILAAGGALVWRFARPKPPAAPLQVVRLTSYPGLARQPAFSPDGKQIAFAWNGETQDNYDVYVKFLSTGDPLRLTSHPGVDGWPAWSPDGRMIAYSRWVRWEPSIDVLTVPALGGPERKILQLRIRPQPAANFPGLCWTPDGKWILLGYTSDPNALPALALVSVETLEIRLLTRPGSGDCCPAITPNGRRLAFLRTSAGRIPNVYFLSLGPDYRPEGEPRQLTHEPSGATNPMWTGDGREVLYLSSREGVRTLWRVPRDGSRPPSPIESLGAIGMNWAISTRGDRLAYSDRERNADIWRVDLPGGKHLDRIVSSSASDWNPEISPDGKRLAFMSERLGGLRVWVSGSDGAKPMDIAKGGGPWPTPARWSPDGNQIVFECRNESNDDICVTPASGGAVRRLTRHAARYASPSWSRDGKWIYFTSNRSGSFQIWKAPADGTGEAAVQVTNGGGYSAVESTDGKTVFFARDRLSGGVWKVSTQGGPETQVGAFRVLGRSQNYAVRPEGIYYASSLEPEKWFELWLFRFASEKSEPICRIEKRLGDGLSVSPDGRWLWFSADEFRDGNLYMVENFR